MECINHLSEVRNLYRSIIETQHTFIVSFTTSHSTAGAIIKTLKCVFFLHKIRTCGDA